MAKIGDWSYSLYLWHWPLIVFASLLWPTTPWAKPLAAVVCIIPALLSYHLLENPIRHDPTIVGKRLVVAIALALVPAIGAAGFLGLGSRNAWWTPPVQDFGAAVVPIHMGRANGCAGFSPLGTKAADCTWDADASGPPVYLVGDSNADHFSEGLEAASAELDRPFMTASTNVSMPREY